MNSNVQFSPANGLTSPTTPSTGSFSRRESMTSNSDDYRRRTWHPDSRFQNPYNNYYSTGPPPQVPVVPSNAPPLRLPGIESFDPIPRQQSPVRRQPSPMVIDTPSRAMPPDYRQERPTSQHWDMNRTLNRLDISNDGAGSWASETNRAVQTQGEQARAQPPTPQTVRFEESPYSARSQQNAYQHQSAPPVTPREQRRHGWYNGPITTSHNPVIDPRLQRTSPADSSGSENIPGTPSSATITGFSPGIVHPNGYVEVRTGIAPVPASRVLASNAPSSYQPNGEAAYTYAQVQQPAQQPQQVPEAPESKMSALDTLVAAATASQQNAF